MIGEKLQKALAEVFAKYGATIAEAARQVLAGSNKNASGNLSKSITFKVIADENIISLEIYAEEYLKYIENGIKPGSFPPILEIMKWIKIRGIQSRGVVSYPGIKRGQPKIIRRNVKKSDEAFAYAISKKIFKQGLKPTGLLKPVLADIQEPMNEELAKTISTITGQELAEIWTSDNPNSNLLTFDVKY